LKFDFHVDVSALHQPWATQIEGQISAKQSKAKVETFTAELADFSLK
jgi:hypothetical protein